MLTNLDCFLFGVVAMGLFSCNAADNVHVREPAVAGQFYTSNTSRLRQEVEQYLVGGSTLEEHPQMIISPHAGYPYSGALAAQAYATVNPATHTVILLGPSHRVPFRGLAASGAHFFETPLGKVPVNTELVKRLCEHRLVSVNDRAHAPEHCLEVQLPFLQVRLESFSIVPLLMLDADPQEVAEMLAPVIDEKTLVVASSDLAHVHSYDECKELDAQSVKTILAGSVNGPLEACGELPIRVLMRLAKMRGATPVLLDARNSQDVTGQRGAGYVVGYAAVAFVKNGADATTRAHETAGGETHAQQSPGECKAAMDISSSDRNFLLSLARDALNRAVRGEAPPTPEIVPDIAQGKCGCFVTLTIGGRLRGCIGYIEGIKPLYQAVIDNAKNAALGDPRFSKVSPDELDRIKVEVSVLTRPEPLEYENPDALLAKLVPGRDGIILRKEYAQSTFLPQVWEQLPDKVAFLEHLARKAGLSADAWKSAEYRRYHAIHFEEN